MLKTADLESGIEAVTLPERIRCSSSYNIKLPDWLKKCIANVPVGSGDSCPTDPEALLALSFDFAYQLHQGRLYVANRNFFHR